MTGLMTIMSYLHVDVTQASTFNETSTQTYWIRHTSYEHLKKSEETAPSPSLRLHPHRAARRYRHHCDPGQHAFARACQSENQGPGHHVHEQSETGHARLADVPTG